MVTVQVADLGHENFKSSRVMRWWLRRLSSRFGAKSSRERKPKWLSGLSPSDHFPVFTTLSINPSPLSPPTLHSFRRFHRIHISSFLTHPNHLAPSLHTIPLSPLYLINMHLSSRSSPDVSPHPTPRLLLPSVFLDLLSATMKTSGNTPTLLLTGPVSSLFAISTTT